MNIILCLVDAAVLKAKWMTNACRREMFMDSYISQYSSYIVRYIFIITFFLQRKLF